MVNDRLEQVYKGLGEMQSLAVGVGDLKRVLSNVKTRGILGEIQLGAILEEMLAPEQYVENVVTSPRGKERVEFAIKIPGDDDGFALLRGRDAKGNIAARKLAAAHDIWLHTDGGPGSHVIIRRAHAGQEVPERTLDQAGALAACKSWQKDAARARILYAEVRHIRSMRGAGTGTVRMDKILYSREVPVDASLETRLLPESPAGKTDGTGRD